MSEGVRGLLERFGVAVPDETWAEMEDRHRRAVARDQAALAVVLACEHGVTETQRQDTLVRVYQHGDNPEARLEVPEHSLILTPALSFAPIVAEWVERIHAYERPATESTGDSDTLDR